MIGTIDFTVKENWCEVKKPSFTARFDYFNGAHAVPIAAKKGETITFSVKFTNLQKGGYGFHVLNGENDFIGMKTVNEQTYQIEAKESRIYRIIVEGDDLKGSFLVTWDVNQPEADKVELPELSRFTYEVPLATMSLARRSMLHLMQMGWEGD